MLVLDIYFSSFVITFQCCLTGDHTPDSGLTSVPNSKNSTSWYGRLSAEKKKEHLEKLRKSRQKKRDAALNVNQGNFLYVCSNSCTVVLRRSLVRGEEHTPISGLTIVLSVLKWLLNIVVGRRSHPYQWSNQLTDT
jgi:hypothetical protein